MHLANAFVTACLLATAGVNAEETTPRRLVTMEDPCHFVQDATGKAIDWTWNPLCYAPDSTMSAPAAWAAKYPTCGGIRQSPLNIDSYSASANCYPEGGISAGVTFNSGYCTFGELGPELGHGLELGYKECELEHPGASPSMQANGKTYKVLQIHFHASSEHTIDGAYADAELHIVHANVADPNDLVVLGVMIKESESTPFDPSDAEVYKWWSMLNNAAYAKAHATAPAHRDLTVKVDTEEIADAYALLPLNTSYYTYLGSLTTPPCSEIVTWVVLTEPVYVSAAQLWWFQNSIHEAAGPYLSEHGGSNRPVQAQNGRVVSVCEAM